ncbi:hypothetical protein [Paraburkholderia caledonica]|uniref:Uncharacterized protein n=1 Tax=Paraburkholderia caledonica TaxID=134536 RepID=A0AB73IP53_9BURK|nr:hypothetical protein [Paraburkholderia caledonica]
MTGPACIAAVDGLAAVPKLPAISCVEHVASSQASAMLQLTKMAVPRTWSDRDDLGRV